jgi:uncharacterized protein with GYD domain
MPKYLFKVRYTSEGLEGVMNAGGSARRAVASDLAKNLGGEVESFHFAFGEDDVYVICDLPDDESAAAIAFTVSASGGATTRTTKLLTVEQVDSALGMQVAYTAPGA